VLIRPCVLSECGFRACELNRRERLPTGGKLMTRCSRRKFMKTGIAAAALAGVGDFSLKAARQTATEWVTRGKTNIKVTRLPFGTGSRSGQVQRELGQEEFTRLV